VQSEVQLKKIKSLKADGGLKSKIFMAKDYFVKSASLLGLKLIKARANLKEF
jgi:hypothetical protein